MAEKVRCLQCDDENYPTDPVCLSCGADLLGEKSADSSDDAASEPEEPEQADPPEEAAERPPRRRRLVDPTRNSPHTLARRKRRAVQDDRARRAARIEELTVQVESLIDQGYHKLPKPPGDMYGPADDVSDLCREIGECCVRNDDPEQAVKWFERALVISPGNIPARAYLVGALCRLGRYDEAKVCYEETPGDPIDKNVVRGWLDAPDDILNEGVADRRQASRIPSLDDSSQNGRADADRIAPSDQRSLPIPIEPRIAVS